MEMLFIIQLLMPFLVRSHFLILAKYFKIQILGGVDVTPLNSWNTPTKLWKVMDTELEILT